jgi:hypothetical protein
VDSILVFLLLLIVRIKPKSGKEFRRGMVFFIVPAGLRACLVAFATKVRKEWGNGGMGEWVQSGVA